MKLLVIMFAITYLYATASFLNDMSDSRKTLNQFVQEKELGGAANFKMTNTGRLVR